MLRPTPTNRVTYPKMMASYNSYPSGYYLEITWLDEKTGKFLGSFAAGKSNSERIKGWFHFENSAQKTTLSFTTSTSSFSLAAPYGAGKPEFEELEGTVTSKVDGNQTAVKFYVDKSGEVRSWFGAVGWASLSGEDL